MDNIYVITVFEHMRTKSMSFTEDKKIANPGCKVLVGWYPSFAEARDVLVHNKTDLWETAYDYGVIETVPKGMYNFEKEKVYFKYDKEADMYKEIEDILPEFEEFGFNFCRIGE